MSPTKPTRANAPSCIGGTGYASGQTSAYGNCQRSASPKYTPSNPQTAPEAPIIGSDELGFRQMWTIAPQIPQTRNTASARHWPNSSDVRIPNVQRNTML